MQPPLVYRWVVVAFWAWRSVAAPRQRRQGKRGGRPPGVVARRRRRRRSPIYRAASCRVVAPDAVAHGRRGQQPPAGCPRPASSASAAHPARARRPEGDPPPLRRVPRIVELALGVAAALVRVRRSPASYSAVPLAGGAGTPGVADPGGAARNRRAARCSLLSRARRARATRRPSAASAAGSTRTGVPAPAPVEPPVSITPCRRRGSPCPWAQRGDPRSPGARHLGRHQPGCATRARCLHLHRRLSASTTSRHRRRSRPRARQYGAETARIVDCAGELLVEEGLVRPAVRRVPHPHRRQDVLQHHAARPRRHRHAARAGDERRRRRHLGRRLAPTRATTSSGSTATACWPTRKLRIYKPWLDGDFVRRARRPRRDERVPRSPTASLPRPDEKALLDRRQHLGRHPRGEDARAARRRRSTSSSRSWASRRWRPSTSRSSRRTSRSRFEAGPPGRDQRRRSSPTTGRARRSRPTRIGGRHGLGMTRPDREPHHRGQERAASTRPRAWRCCTSPTSAW